MQMRQVAAKGAVGQVGTDLPVAIRLKYVGSGTVTSVTTTTATNIVMITSDGGTDTYAFATYTTVATLAAAINADGIFEAKILDTLPSETTASQFVTGAITSSTLDGVTIWDVLVDTSAAKYFAYRLTSDRGFNNTPSGNRRVHLKEFVYYITLGGAGANLVKVYDVKGSTETLVYQQASVSATKTTENWASGNGYLTADEGHDLLVYLSDGTSISDAAANYLYVSGLVE